MIVSWVDVEEVNWIEKWNKDNIVFSTVDMTIDTWSSSPPVYHMINSFIPLKVKSQVWRDYCW